MYIIVKDKQIIAAHDDIEVVHEYWNSQNDPDMKILKVKKKKSAELIEIPDFENIYLVRYGDFYVPYEQYEALKELNGQRDFDLRYCRDVLFRLLEENVVSTKEASILKKTLPIVISQIESIDDSEYEALDKLRKDLEEMKPLGGN